MKAIKNIGLVVFLIGMLIFTSASFVGDFQLSKEVLVKEIEGLVSAGQVKESIAPRLLKAVEQSGAVGQKHGASFQLAHQLIAAYDNLNNEIIAEIQASEVQDWNLKMFASSTDFASSLVRKSAGGVYFEMTWLMFLLTFGLAIVGGLMFIVPDMVLLGAPGIKNDKMFQDSSTNRGWVGFIVFGYLVGFYVLLYFYPYFLINQIELVNPISQSLSGGASSQWFLYGFIYCAVMTVMAVRMFIKYRHNNYQMVRTAVVLFFQVAFAFLIPEILVRFQLPYMDLKNAWPLDYDFFYSYNLDQLQAQGLVGVTMLVWGVILTVVVVPVMVYFYGKRWYCSWVCGCGGLAETLGDPYRQLSSKKLHAWKIERWLIHGVLVFATFMTIITIGAYFNNSDTFLGIKTYSIQGTYGFLIGSIFSGVIGTGFYPVLGSRSWCRFGCPLAAYMGIIQRFKSRFRITTNGGQCISCGNCSTYCEQGIDVRWYAQRGQNIVRSSCVGCGVCSAVCPRGVLNLENGPEEGRINDLPIIIGQNKIEIAEQDK